MTVKTHRNHQRASHLRRTPKTRREVRESNTTLRTGEKTPWFRGGNGEKGGF